MKNLNLIRKIAGQFAKKTELEYDELFSEAALAYSEALHTFDSGREVKFITYAVWCMKNHLVNICKFPNYYCDPRSGKAVSKSTAISQTVDEWPEQMHPTAEPEPTSIWEVIEEWPEDCQQVAEMVLTWPEKYLAATPNYRRRYVGQKRRLNKVRKDLKNKLGWSPQRIEKTVQGIQSELQIV